ncbi:MAG: membrane protein insertion efficiency factor YidD [Campylobacter lanienae]|uniref:membrane protein insertion efficiency factor YidD n=1 Tax=Campylobacter lanienae TaxID=75658 RepID=UPI002431B07E|nr:membrane protein insertion efficiency factor YidD [Campylobacter lanienae]MCI5540003.1 membrane protein insertion efficiency factor YidD [Campylobacter lanienae]
MKIATSLVVFYKKYISPLLPRSCRYYPSCSEYALWHLSNSGIISSIFAITLRILRCNQLFKGGIDYPIVKRKFAPSYIFFKHSCVEPKFWLIKQKKDKFYLIKAFDLSKDKKC